MLECDGIRMFHGTVKVSPMLRLKEPFDLTGTWMYKPVEGVGYWYCKQDSNGWTSSFCEDVLSDFRDDADEQVQYILPGQKEVEDSLEAMMESVKFKEGMN